MFPSSEPSRRAKTTRAGPKYPSKWGEVKTSAPRGTTGVKKTPGVQAFWGVPNVAQRLYKLLEAFKSDGHSEMFIAIPRPENRLAVPELLPSMAICCEGLNQINSDSGSANSIALSLDDLLNTCLLPALAYPQNPTSTHANDHQQAPLDTKSGLPVAEITIPSLIPSYRAAALKTWNL